MIWIPSRRHMSAIDGKPMSDKPHWHAVSAHYVHDAVLSTPGTPLPRFADMILYTKFLESALCLPCFLLIPLRLRV